MGQRQHTPPTSNVEKVLLRCVAWSRKGLHRKVLAEVDQLLAQVGEQQSLKARLLAWKAQALLELSLVDQALAAATQSWDIELTSHACHLMSNALYAIGEARRSAELLQLGCKLFPEAAYLPLQLAMLFTDQGLLREALSTLDELNQSQPLPHDLAALICSLKAGILTHLGRWHEAGQDLENGLRQHPGSELLKQSYGSFHQQWLACQAEETLARVWECSLAPLDGAWAEVDDAIVSCGVTLGRTRLEILATRRLWHSFTMANKPHPQTPRAWAAASFVACLELDDVTLGQRTVTRTLGVSLSTTRYALDKLRGFVAALEPKLARHCFAAHTNPQLTGSRDNLSPASKSGTVVPFPHPRNQ